MMGVCDRIREVDRIGDQRGVGLSPSLISKAGWFSTLIPPFFVQKMGGTLGKGFAVDIDNDIFLSIVIPAYNEEKRLSRTISEIAKYLASFSFKSELIIVDDGSTDRTAQLIDKMTVSHPYLQVIHLKKNRGKGFAVRKGILEAKGKYILFSDADLSTPISEAGKLLIWLYRGYDIAIGSRKLPQSKIEVRQSILREIAGSVFNMIVQTLILQGVKDTQCGFKCFTRKSAKHIFREQRLNKFSFDVEVLYLANKYGYKIKEVPVRWLNSSGTTIRLMRDSLKMFLDLLKVRYNDIVGNYSPSDIRKAD